MTLETVIIAVDGSDASLDAVRTGFACLPSVDNAIVLAVIEPADPSLVLGTGFAGGVMTSEELDREQQARTDEGKQHADAAAAALGLADPDILVLNEALFCREHAGHRFDYADLFGYPYETAALYDGAWGNAILSRHPIARSQELRIYNRGGLTAVTTGSVIAIDDVETFIHRVNQQDFIRVIRG